MIVFLTIYYENVLDFCTACFSIGHVITSCRHHVTKKPTIAKETKDENSIRGRSQGRQDYLPKDKSRDVPSLCVFQTIIVNSVKNDGHPVKKPGTSSKAINMPQSVFSDMPLHDCHVDTTSMDTHFETLHLDTIIESLQATHVVTSSFKDHIEPLQVDLADATHLDTLNELVQVIVVIANVT